MRSIPDALSVPQSPFRCDVCAPTSSRRATMSGMRHVLNAVVLLAGMALGWAAAPSLAPTASAQPAHFAHAAVSVSHSVTAAITPLGGCRGTPAPC